MGRVKDFMRLFIAIDISDQMRQELDRAQGALKKTGADVKWVSLNNIHITMKFLGETSDDVIDDVKNAMDNAARGMKKFEISLSEIGTFPGTGNPKVIWAGVGKNHEIIEDLASKIETECEKIGFAKEDRPFKAHLTLGRTRSPKNIDLLKKMIPEIKLREAAGYIQNVVLYRSVLSPKGPEYSKVHSSSFTGKN